MKIEFDTTSPVFKLFSKFSNMWLKHVDKFIRELISMGLDGIEVYYPYPRWRKYIKFSTPEDIEKIANKYHLIKTGGTDCHSKYL